MREHLGNKADVPRILILGLIGEISSGSREKPVFIKISLFVGLPAFFNVYSNITSNTAYSAIPVGYILL